MRIYCEYREISPEKQVETTNLCAFYANEIYKTGMNCGFWLGYECNNGRVTTMAYEIERG